MTLLYKVVNDKKGTNDKSGKPRDEARDFTKGIGKDMLPQPKKSGDTKLIKKENTASPKKSAT